MVTTVLQRQPTKLDYAEPTKFRFSISKLPKVEYFCTAANIPGISLGSAEQPTPLKDIPIPGDKLSYDNLEITFLIDENLENYREKQVSDDGGIYSDATLFSLTSKNNSNIEVRFRNLYPISLSGLNYNQQETDIQYLTASVSFAYTIYEFANVGGSGTIETTT